MTVETPRATSEPAPVTLPARPRGWAWLKRSADTFADLFFIQFSFIRTGWQWIFLVSNALPLGILVFLSFIAPHAGRTTLLYFISGNVIVALMLNPIFMLSGNFAWARQSKAFDFYAGLPISRTTLILAAIAVSVIFTVPGMVLLLVLGMLTFHLWLLPNPLIVLVLLLSPTALSGLGVGIGVLAPNQQVAGVTANLFLVIVMFFSPIFAPLSKLPGVLQATAHLLPPTYAADALRQTLNERITPSFGLDLLVMLLFSLASIYLVTSRLDWRSR